ncbi:MAG: PBSX family phage terminase large subunit [Bacteroidota bacterium]|nr:PBSX family phage terminase large subunit [Bacteroidota bacterium]
MGRVINLEFKEDIFLPIYRPLVHNSELFDIDFMYGGRDSGKSYFIAAILLICCLQLPYFRCVLIRKVSNTIKESQWQLMKDIIDGWGLSHLFRFNKNPLEISCVNGNKFICRGLDEPAKLKSISNPSHCWVEEGNQITSEDFVTILTTLRYNQGNTKTWFSFNPECEVNYTDFWLYQEWFSHTTALSFQWIRSIDVGDEKIDYTIRATHSTYKDNPYCKPKRKALYESYKTSKNNQYWYQTYTLGLWGYKKTGGEFWTCFDETKHTHSLARHTNAFHVVADNNRVPYVAVQLWQVDQSIRKADQVGELACAIPNATASKAASLAAAELTRRGSGDLIFVYGDPSANAGSTQDDEGRSFFDKFIGKLKEEGFRVINRVGRSAPGVAESGSFVNEIYESNYSGWEIRIDASCRKSIEDYTMVKMDDKGKMLKKRETDADTKVSFERYGHFSDCKRYFITTILAEQFTKYKEKRKRGGSISANRA